jgi:hypothetical protein
MKKVAALLIFIAYGLASAGTSLHVHFCCGKLDNITLVPVQKKNCKENCSKEKEGCVKEVVQCCNNAQIDLKLHAEQTAPAVFHFDAHPPLFEVSPFLALTTEDVAVRQPLPADFLPPPLSQSYLTLFCVYRI